MSQQDLDLFVIGAGSGGVRAARVAAGFGARVAVAEDRYLGGTCVNVGCVPKKLYVYASEFGHAFADAREFGWRTSPGPSPDNASQDNASQDNASQDNASQDNASQDNASQDNAAPDFDWATLRDNKKREIARLNGVYRDLLQGTGVEIIEGRARILDSHTVEINGERRGAEKILIATGGWPRRPDIPGGELAVSSNEIFDLDEFPRRIAIIGGGYIAVEFAGIFNGLGAEVTQLYRGPLFLRGFDQDLREHAARELPARGIDLRFDARVEAIGQGGEYLRCTLSDGSCLEVDQVLCAIGRTPRLDELGLENVDVARNDNGTIQVDDEYRTSEPSIFALGDVTGGKELTPVALAEGMSFARRQFGPQPGDMEYDFIPSAVFCQPPIGTVGFTEEEARQAFGNITVYRSRFRPMKHTISGRDENTLMKLIVDDATDRVVGVHMMGPDAGEIIQGMAVALKAGATKATFDATIGIHPTAAEEFVTMREPAPAESGT